MSLIDLWKKLCRAFRLIPAAWSISPGDETEGPYRHSTSILALSFSPDDSLLALAGGGCIPGADGSVRLIDVATHKNVQTLQAHIHGVHDVSFDPKSGVLASASFDYAVHLWDLAKEDVIFLRGEDNKTKGYCQFTRDGSLLAIGEYAYYEGPHSFYVYDLKTQKNVFEFALPDEMGVTAMALSPDSTYLAVTASDQNPHQATRLYLVQLGTLEIVREHTFKDIGFYALAFINGHDRLVGGVDGGSFSEYESGLIEIDAHSGEIKWSEQLGGIGVSIACHPEKSEIAVGFEGDHIRFYDPKGWKLLRRYQFKHEADAGKLCALAYSRKGNLLAYGLSSGHFEIIEAD